MVTGQGIGALGDVHVYLLPAAGGAPLREARTDFAGRFAFLNIAAGSYTLRLARPGWQEELIDSVQVPAGDSADVFLELSADLPTALDPAPEPQLWNRNNWWGTEYGDVALRQYATSRTVWSLLENQGISTVTQTLDTSQLETGTPSLFGNHGASWTENQYLFNGFDASDPYVTGRALVDPDYAALTGVTDVMGAKPANLGTSGSTLILNVREPQSILHGQAGLYFSTRALQSDNMYGFLRAQGFPGPERMNRLYDANAQIGTTLPFAHFSWPFFVAFSAQQLSKDLGGFAAPINAHANHILVQLSPYQRGRGRLNLLYAGQQEFNSHDGAGINVTPSATQRRNDNFHQFQARWRNTLSAASVFEAGFGVTHAILSSGLQPGVAATSTLNLPDAIQTGAAPLSQAGRRTRYQTTAALRTLRSGWLGSHGLSFGGDLDFSTMSNRWFALNGMQQILVSGAGSNVIQWSTPATARQHVRNFSLFAQDAWRPMSWIAIPVGVRLAKSVGQADGAGNRINWTTLEPRLGLVLGAPRAPWLVFRGSWSRYGHQLQGQYLDYGNPAALTGRMYAWDDSNSDTQAQPSEIGQLLRRFGGPFSGIGAGLRRPYTDEITLGFEARAGSFYRLRVRGYRRDDFHLIQAVNSGVLPSDYIPTVVNDPYIDNLPTDIEAYKMLTLYNQTPSSLGNDFITLGNPPGYRAKAKGVDVEMSFRSGNRWEINGSFTAEATNAHTIPGNSVFQNDTGMLNPQGNNPNTAVNNSGVTYFDRGKYGKLSVYYNFPFGIRAAGIIRYLDGFAYSPLLFVNGFNQGPFFVLALPRNDFVGFRTEFNSTTDLRVSKTFALPLGAVEVDLDIFNLLNKHQYTQEHDLAGPLLLQLLRLPRSIQAPRTARLGVEWRF